MKKQLLLLIVALAFCSRSLLADEHHHVDTNQKPRTVSFPSSCEAGVHELFERGVALLHSFEYAEAEKLFKKVADNDPECALANWGEAMSLNHPLWNLPDQLDLKRGWELVQKAQAIGARTAHERDYIDAIAAFYRDYDKVDHGSRTKAYAQAMGKVYDRYPKDHSAAAFYALSLLSSGDRTKAIKILNQLLKAEPNHPGGVHYLIHACDTPQLAHLGLVAARRYANISPSSPHALHMPSHIFARLGLWQEDIRSNLASLAATRDASAMHMGAEHRVHAMDFLEYAYLQIGDNNKAKTMVDELGTVREADIDPSLGDYYSYACAHFPALYALETRQWKDAMALQPPSVAEPYNQAITYWARAIGAGHLRDTAAARNAIEQYDLMIEATRRTEKAYIADLMDFHRDEARAWLAFAEKKNQEALSLLHFLADKQDAVGTGEGEIPAREMLADMLLEMKRPQEALTEYEKSLKTDRNRFNGLYGAARAAELAHKPEEAAAYYAQLLKNCDNGALSDRPELAWAKTQLARR